MSNFKLYYTPTSCGAASFLTATMGGLQFDSEIVDLRSHKTQSGADFYSINPKGNVPTIAFDDGTILNENVAALTYLADQGNAKLSPPPGTAARYQYLNHLGFVATEVHKSYGVLFNPTLDDATRSSAKETVQKKVKTLLDTYLDGGSKKFLNDSSPSAADIYAHIVLGWSDFLEVDIPKAAREYADGIKGLDAVQQARATMLASSK